MVWKASKRRMGRDLPRCFRGIVMTVQCSAASRALISSSSGRNLSTPIAAASNPTMPLLVGKSAVARRVKREAKPHDCSGPSRKRARQALLDMVGEAFDEVVETNFRDVHFRITLDTPRFLELFVMFKQSGLGFRQQAVTRSDWLLEGIDELKRLARVLVESEHERRQSVAVHGILASTGGGQQSGANERRHNFPSFRCREQGEMISIREEIKMDRCISVIDCRGELDGSDHAGTSVSAFGFEIVHGGVEVEIVIGAMRRKGVAEHGSAFQSQ